MSDVLTTETVKALRDAGPKDLIWLICDSHEALRALAEQRGEALRNLIAWADGKVGDDFGTTEWESARAALADGGQQENQA